MRFDELRVSGDSLMIYPLEFMQRLAALVPRPGLHLIRFHGVLASNAKLRSEIIPTPVEDATEPSTIPLTARARRRA